MEEGFLKLARRYFSHPFWREQREFSRAEAWLDLVQACAYQPHETLVNGSLIEVPRGSIVASERWLSDRWTWSRTKVRAYLDLLEKKQMISIEKDHQRTVITLCNYEKYNGEQTTEKPKKNHQKTTQEPPNGTSWGTIGGKEERKESKKVEAKASTSADRSRGTQSELVAYVVEQGLPAADGDWLYDKMLASGWRNNGQAVKDWQAQVRTWKRHGYFPSQKGGKREPKPQEPKLFDDTEF